MPAEDAARIAEMTAKGLGQDITLVEKAAAGLRRLTFIVKEVLLWVKCQQIGSQAAKKLATKESIDVANFVVVLFEETAAATQPSAATALICQQPSATRPGRPPAKRIQPTKGSGDA